MIPGHFSRRDLLATLTGVHDQRRKLKRRFRPYAEIPAPLFVPGTNGKCRSSCVACAVTGCAPAITPALVASLTHGRAGALRVLLTIYKHARVYANMPLGSSLEDRLFHATARLSLNALAGESLGACWTVQD